MAGSDQITTQIEQVVYRRMDIQEPLGLGSGLESPNTLLSRPRRLVRLLHPVVGVPVRHVKWIRSQCPVGYPIPAQLEVASSDAASLAAMVTVTDGVVVERRADMGGASANPSPTTSHTVWDRFIYCVFYLYPSGVYSMAPGNSISRIPE